MWRAVFCVLLCRDDCAVYVLIVKTWRSQAQFIQRGDCSHRHFSLVVMTQKAQRWLMNGERRPHLPHSASLILVILLNQRWPPLQRHQKLTSVHESKSASKTWQTRRQSLRMCWIPLGLPSLFRSLSWSFPRRVATQHLRRASCKMQEEADCVARRQLHLFCFSHPYSVFHNWWRQYHLLIWKK